MDREGRPSSIYAALSLFNISEAEAARELGRIRAAIAAWRVADYMAWPVRFLPDAIPTAEGRLVPKAIRRW